jgi:hypothetical protein
MKTLFKRFEKWFDLNLGWFFINGKKQEQYCEYLKEKYPDEYKASK